MEKVLIKNTTSKTTRKTSGMVSSFLKSKKKITGTFFKKENTTGTHMPLTKLDNEKMALVGRISTTLNILTM
jgi:hypothetical protein